MTTSVIHIRDSKKSTDEHYIGRAGKYAPQAIFGNPIVKGQRCRVCGRTHLDGGSTLPCYEIYLRSRLSTDDSFAKRFWALKGGHLVCFCRPKDGFGDKTICHGQIMARYLDDGVPRVPILNVDTTN